MAALRLPSWRTTRKIVRALRITFLGIVVLMLAVVLWLNGIGFPQWVVNRVEAELRQKNLDVEIDRLRLRGISQIIGTNLRVDSPGQGTAGPTVHLPRWELLLNWSGWFDVSVGGIAIQQGRIDLPVHSTNAPPRFLVVSNINTELRFLPGDVWSLQEVAASALGMRARVRASVTNVSDLVAMINARPATLPPQAWRSASIDLMQILDELSFSTAPEFDLSISGNGTRADTYDIRLRVTAEDVETRKGAVGRMHLLSSIRPGSEQTIRGAFLLQVSDAQVGELSLEKGSFSGETHWSSNLDRLITNHVSVELSQIESRWIGTPAVEASIQSTQEAPDLGIRSTLLVQSAPLKLFNGQTASNVLQAELQHTLPFPYPSVLLSRFLPQTNLAGLSASHSGENSIRGEWSWRTPELKWVDSVANDLRLAGEVESIQFDRIQQHGLGPWKYLLPFRMPWQFAVSNIIAEKVNIGSMRASGEWNPPRLAADSFHAELYGGELTASAALDILTRELTGSAQGRFDYHGGALLLDKPVQRWLADFSWETPPAARTVFRIQFPPWESQWKQREILSTLALNGSVDGAGRFKSIPFAAVRSSLSFSNFVWNLPDLQLDRPEGTALVAYTGNVTNSNFAVEIESTLDPDLLRPIFPEAKIAFNMVDFSQPPGIRGHVAGNWSELEKTHFTGGITATNLFVRGDPISLVRLQVEYTNLVVECRDLFARRGPEEVTAPYLRVDIPGELMFVTNAVSTMNPWWAMSLIGEDTYDAIDPYRFEELPRVLVNGIVPLRHWKKADIHFNVSGEKFSYWKFNLPRLSGDVYWKGENISFSNVVASFYKGSADWSGHFHINEEKSADFSFRSQFHNADLKLLMADLIGGTNHMQGTLNGELIVTSANSDDFRGWDGYGSAHLSKGFLWNVPVFGVFSPMIDAVVPGESLSGVTAADGTFSITNSIVYTDDLQVKAPAFRLRYTGNVDLDGTLDAVVEAEILRDAWIFGKVVSTVLWPVSKAFEAKVSGTVQEPKTNLRYFPKFMLAPLKVFGTIKSAVRGKEAGEKSMPPPAQPPPN